MSALKGLIAAAVVATVAWTLPGLAQTFPNKPVKVILPYPTGTGPDAVMRQVADKLTRWWGQPVIVDNRGGAHGWLAAEAVRKSAPDGYTLFQGDNLNFALQPHIFRKIPFDWVKDFEPVAPLFNTHYFVTVAANSSWNSLSDLIAAAKAESGGVTYGSSGVASHMHLGGAMLETATGTKMTHVPNRDTAGNFVLVANGEISWAFGTASTSGPMYRAKKVKYLALSGPQRHPNFPEIPTVAEALNLPDFELKAWIAIFAPRGTPKAIIDKLNADIARALNEPDVRERMINVGFDPWPGTSAELAKAIEDDSKLFSEVAKRENISLD